MTNTAFIVDGIQLCYPGHEKDWRQHQIFTLHNQFDALDLRKRRMILKQEEFEQRMARLQSLHLSYSGWQQDLYQLEIRLLTNGTDCSHRHGSRSLTCHVVDDVDFDTLLQMMLSKQKEHEESNIRPRQETEPCPSPHSYSPSNDAPRFDTDPSRLPFVQSEVVHPVVEPTTPMVATTSLPTQSQQRPRMDRSWSLKSRLLSRKTTPSCDRPEQHSSAGIGNCIICLTQPKEVAVVPCGHLCMCTACANEISKRTRTRQCPICRQKFRSTLRVFVT